MFSEQVSALNNGQLNPLFFGWQRYSFIPIRNESADNFYRHKNSLNKGGISVPMKQL